MNSIVSTFSTESREMIGVSKDIAISLGYDRISTLHFFLANCALDQEYSLRNFAFKTDDEYQEFYNSCKLDKPGKFTSDPVPLTAEAEKALRMAVQIWFRRYQDDEIKSYHILLAASKKTGSLFAAKLNKKANLQKHLEQYYLEKGIIHEKNIKRNFWEKLSKIWIQ